MNWEYRIESIRVEFDQGKETSVMAFNNLGKERWELVHVETIYIDGAMAAYKAFLKRPMGV